MKYHGVTNYLENKSNIQTKKLNIEYFKYNIFICTRVIRI